MPNRLRTIKIKKDQTTNNRYYKNIEYPEIPVRSNPDKVKRDSFFLNPGLQIRIPSEIESIYESFERLNR